MSPLSPQMSTLYNDERLDYDSDTPSQTTIKYPITRLRAKQSSHEKSPLVIKAAAEKREKTRQRVSSLPFNAIYP